MRNTKLLILLLLFSNTTYSQKVYQIGVAQKSIEPQNNLISLALGGYAGPWEGRFTLQWINKEPISSVTALGALNNKLYIVCENELLWKDPSEKNSTWKNAGNAINIKSIAGLKNELYAITRKGELLEANATKKKIKWKKIGDADNSLTTITAFADKLYAANENGSFWVTNISKKIKWSEIKSLKLKGIVSLAVNDRKLFALTDKGIIYQCGISKQNNKWLEAAYKNGNTIKEDIRHIAIAGDSIYGISKENILYKGEHRSNGNLSTRAIAINDDKNTVVIVSVDVAGLNDSFIGLIKDEIFRTTGIPHSSIFINMSHTHFAPVSQDWSTWQEPNHHPDSVYLLSTIQNGILKAAYGAIENMHPAELFFGRGITDIGYNRSLKDHPELYDSDVDVIKFDYIDKDTENYLFIAACHPVFSTTGKLHYTISANYPGVARNLVEKRTDTSNSLFLQGTAGDINPKDNGEYITGGKLANEVINTLERPMEKVTGPISFYLDTINIPISPWTKEELIEFHDQNNDNPGNMKAERNLNWCDLMLNYYKEEKMPTSLPVYIHTINIGNWKLVGFSREATSGYSLDVKNLWPDKLISVVGYTNDVSSYLPTHMHIEKKNYEGLGSFFWYGVPNTFPITVDNTIISFIKEHKR